MHFLEGQFIAREHWCLCYSGTVQMSRTYTCQTELSIIYSIRLTLTVPSNNKERLQSTAGRMKHTYKDKDESSFVCCVLHV